MNLTQTSAQPSAQSFPDMSAIRHRYVQSEPLFQKAMTLFISDMCTLTLREPGRFRIKVEDRFDDFDVLVDLTTGELLHTCTCRHGGPYCSHAAAALIYLADLFEDEEEGPPPTETREGEPYTRDEMIRRVLKERNERAAKESYNLELGDNVYGFHTLRTERGTTYQLTIRDFDTGNGYCSCPDFKTNKLGTCKHLIFAKKQITKTLPVKDLVKKQPYPFVEIFCDPLSDYHITYYHKKKIAPPIRTLLEIYFKDGDYILPEHYRSFLSFFNEAREFKQILIRPEVEEKIQRHFESLELEQIKHSVTPDFSPIGAELFPYQQEGIRFSIFKKGSIIADEMGLGKTLQAIGTALLKKDIFGFKKVLVICPASLKFQWKQEIQRFTGLHADVVEGPKKKRLEMHKSSDAYFLIANYEAVLKDITIVKNYPPDMVILDEAQRIKNYDTKTYRAINAIPKKHGLIITGTPIENKLMDLYSIMSFIDPYCLTPLWEFSMNHCIFDKTKKNKINGYYNLQALKERLSDKIIRREKKDVMEQLPEVREMTIPIQLEVEQIEMHMSFARSVAPLMAKKVKTVFDMQRIFGLLTSMRMVCNSTYLIDKETNISPKLRELKEILDEKLNIKETGKKVIIFSEWKTTLQLVEKVLQKLDLGYVMLTGSVPVKKRSALIDAFNNDPDCRVFLSTEAGGTGLNLQVADTVINFELPWNPARKNQRIGRIHRIGQKSSKLTVINLVSFDSIEERILNGIELKESLFEAVLNESNDNDTVDFSRKGRSTMIQQIEKMVSPWILEAEKELEAMEPEWAARGEEDRSGQPEPAPAAGEEAVMQPPSLFDEEVPEEEPLEPRAAPPVQPAEPAKPAEPVEIAAPQPEPVPIEAVPEKTAPSESSPADAAAPAQAVPRPQQLEQTLNMGMQFLNGLFSMATGKELVADEQAITVDRDTGEVVMKFKLPGF